MGERRSRRFNLYLKAALLSASVSNEAFIGNISENGMYVRIRSAGAGIAFVPETAVDIIIILPSDETLNLRCRLVWAYEIPIMNQPGRAAYNLGVEILNQIPAYREFYENIMMKNLNDQLNSLSD